MNAPTDWVSAIVILTAGLILGVLFVIFFSRRKSAAPIADESDMERKDLEGKRDALVRQLRELDADGKHTPAQIDAERRRLESETADVLRRLDGFTTQRAEVPEAAPGAPARAMNPALKGFIWGAASFVALFGLGYFVMKSASPREEGGSPTGGMPSRQQQQAAPQQPDPVVMQLEAAMLADPENLQLRNDLAQAYLERDNIMGVFEQSKFVLSKAPNDGRALTFQGIVKLAMGDPVGAATMLEKATKADPKNLDSWVALAWVYAQSDRMKDAEAMIAEAVRQSPSEKARLEAVFNQMKSHIATAGAASAPAVAQGGELPPGHPPVEGSAPAAAPATGMARPAPPADGKSIRVTLELDPAAKTRTGILYVMAKNPQGGPPIAVKRLMASNFPITLDLGSADSMMGQPLPESFRLEARLDSDGDAATKPPTDPSAVQDNVAPGAVLRLALR